MVPTLQQISMMEPKLSFNRTALLKADKCSFTSMEKVFFVSSSAVKFWMMRIPEMSSWMNAFRLEAFLRKIRQRLWEKSCITVSPTINTGRVERLASARRGLFTSIITTTLATVIKSGIRVVTLLFSTSFKELISPMIRERIFPVGRLSKKWKSSVWIWV